MEREKGKKEIGRERVSERERKKNGEGEGREIFEQK